jgi:enoyl-ACP reductase-like protein
VNTSSVGGTLAAPGEAPYVASKHAVLGLTKSAAVEYGRDGIRVNAVSPGATRTELLLNVFGSQEALDRSDRHTRSFESGYRRKLRKLSFGCFLRIRHIYPASPLSLTADSAHSVRVSDRAERHSRELPSGLIQSSLRTLPRIRRRLQHDRAHQLMPDSPSGSRFRHGYGRTSFPGSEVALCTAMLGRVAFLDLSVAKGSLRFVDQSFAT